MRQLIPSSRTLLGIGLLVVVAALRLPWLEADGGATGFWSYGVFTTDEGNYSSGGRLAYLTGRFFDVPMSEPHTFLHAWGLHVLAWLGYEIRGLTMGAARLPTVVMAILGWGLAYWLASRWTSSLVAFLVTLVVSCNPMSLVYERIVMGHVMVGALVLLGYVSATARRPGWCALAGAAVAVAASVKFTALLFLPVWVAGMALCRRAVRCRLAGFAGSFVLAFGISLAWRAIMIASVPDTMVADFTGQVEVVRNLVSVEVSAWLRSVSYFPRWPVGTSMGPLFVWAFALPVWWLAVSWRRTGRLVTRRNVVAWGVLVYLGALATQTAAPVRYFLPVLYFVPAMVIRARSVAGLSQRQGWLPWAAVAAAVAGMLALYWMPVRLPTRILRVYVANEYIVPPWSAWELNGWWMVISFAAMLVAVTWMIRDRVLAAVLAVTLVFLFFNNHALAANRMIGGFPLDQRLSQLALVVTLAGLLRFRGAWYGLCGGLFLLFAVANSHWRSAYPELMQRKFLERTACQQIAKVVPENAMVVGRRSPTLLRASRCRLGLCLPGYPPGEFTRRLEKLLADFPEQPLYLLMEEDAASWYYPPAEEIHTRMQMDLVGTWPVPSDSSPEPILVSLYRLGALPHPPDAPNNQVRGNAALSGRARIHALGSVPPQSLSFFPTDDDRYFVRDVTPASQPPAARRGERRCGISKRPTRGSPPRRC